MTISKTQDVYIYIYDQTYVDIVQICVYIYMYTPNNINDLHTKFKKKCLLLNVNKSIVPHSFKNPSSPLLKSDFWVGPCVKWDHLNTDGLRFKQFYLIQIACEVL